MLFGGMHISTNKELQTYQKRLFYNLLLIRERNKNVSIEGLDELIHAARVEMDQEDAAFVEKMIAELIAEKR